MIRPTILHLHNPQTGLLRGCTLPGVSGYEYVRLERKGAPDMDGIHAAQKVVFKGDNCATHHFRGKVADCRVDDIGHKHGFEVLVLEWGDQLFTLQAAESRDNFGKGDA